MDAAASGDTDLAAIGALVADPGRCRILLALDDGRALPATRLAAEAGVAPPPPAATWASSQTRDCWPSRPMAATATTAWPDPPSHSSSRRCSSSPRPRRSAPCARTPAPTRCAAPAPATTTSQGGSVWHSWPPSRSRPMTGGDGTFHADAADPTSCPAPATTSTTPSPSGRDFLDRLRRRPPAPPANRPLLRRLDRATPPPRRWPRLRPARPSQDLGWVRPTRGNRAVEITAAGRDGLSDTFGIDPD